MALSKVEVVSDVVLTCTTHALTTETEEVMGLLLGDIKWENGQATSRIWRAVPQIRTDRRKDRVEPSHEQLSYCIGVAEKLSQVTGIETRVVGWYHSHPNITVQPSHVDLRTQAEHQKLDEGFVGLIFSCFNKDQKLKCTAFQSLPGTQEPVQDIVHEDPDMQKALQLSLADSNGGAHASMVTWQHKEVPLEVTEAKGDWERSLMDVVQLQRMLFNEEKKAYEEAKKAEGGTLSLSAMHHGAVYLQSLSRLMDTVLLPSLTSMKLKTGQNVVQAEQLEAQLSLYKKIRQQSSKAHGIDQLANEISNLSYASQAPPQSPLDPSLALARETEAEYLINVGKMENSKQTVQPSMPQISSQPETASSSVGYVGLDSGNSAGYLGVPGSTGLVGQERVSQDYGQVSQGFVPPGSVSFVPPVTLQYNSGPQGMYNSAVQLGQGVDVFGQAGVMHSQARQIGHLMLGGSEAPPVNPVPGQVGQVGQVQSSILGGAHSMQSVSGGFGVIGQATPSTNTPTPTSFLGLDQLSRAGHVMGMAGPPELQRGAAGLSMPPVSSTSGQMPGMHDMGDPRIHMNPGANSSAWPGFGAGMQRGIPTLGGSNAPGMVGGYDTGGGGAVHLPQQGSMGLQSVGHLARNQGAMYLQGGGIANQAQTPLGTGRGGVSQGMRGLGQGMGSGPLGNFGQPHTQQYAQPQVHSGGGMGRSGGMSGGFHQGMGGEWPGQGQGRGRGHAGFVRGPPGAERLVGQGRGGFGPGPGQDQSSYRQNWNSSSSFSDLLDRSVGGRGS